MCVGDLNKYDLLEKQIEQNKPQIILDVCSSDAPYLVKSAENPYNSGRRYIALDINTKKIPNSKKIDFIKGDAKHLPFKPGVIDMITTFGYNPGVFDFENIKEQSRIISDNGVGIIGVLRKSDYAYYPDSNNFNESQLRRIRELLTDSKKIPVVDGPYSIPELQAIYNELSSIISCNEDDLFHILGIVPNEKINKSESGSRYILRNIELPDSPYCLVWKKSATNNYGVKVTSKNPLDQLSDNFFKFE